jgi:hypothetical protein
LFLNSQEKAFTNKAAEHWKCCKVS